jgi:hypothetical protein
MLRRIPPADGCGNLSIAKLKADNMIVSFPIYNPTFTVGYLTLWTVSIATKKVSDISFFVLTPDYVFIQIVLGSVVIGDNTVT